MTHRVFAWLVLSIVAVAAWSVAVAAQGRPDKNSVRDGVYKEEQAKRGEAVYGQECAQCHGNTLEGGDVAPALTGSAFTSNWNGLTLGDLAERIRISMPADRPGKLSRQESADLISYLLKVNRWPAGNAELPSEAAMLKAIKIEANAP